MEEITLSSICLLFKNVLHILSVVSFLIRTYDIERTSTGIIKHLGKGLKQLYNGVGWSPLLAEWTF
jgi:hypothetical protein